MRERIYLCLAHMSGREQDFIKEAFDSNWVVPMGPNVNGFEKDLEEFVNKVDNNGQINELDRKVCCLSAGTAAVHLALLACGVGQGDEVLVQSFTFCASSHPITYLGATPVFVDSERETWNMDPDLLEEAIKDRIAKTGRKLIFCRDDMHCLLLKVLVTFERLYFDCIGKLRLLSPDTQGYCCCRNRQ